jgi:hypothetical protein
MKKLFTLFGIIGVCGFSYAQTQRLVLVEEFTQASCGPCASQNPAFNTLLQANPTKAISIKYQTSWPGVDPMNGQNPTQVATRVSYYGVSGVPHGAVDGAAINNDCNAYAGAPACLNQSEIDAEYNVASPFTIGLTHSFSSDYDSIFITATITATQTVSGTLKGHIVVVEQEINFNTPPGTNGEMDFYSVMRKMLPSDQGTTLPTSWTAGQVQTISIGAPVPSYIYNMNNIGVVAFVQDDATKNVKQAAYSVPQPLSNYAGVSSVSNIPNFQCSGSITPSVVIKNMGSSTLTSATINYKIDNGPVSTQSWTGSLAPNATATVALPATTVTNGSHTFTSYVTSPNGAAVFNTSTATVTKNFSIFLNSMAAPLVEGYTNASFPPANWSIDNPDGGPTWTRKTGAGGFGNSTSCAKMDFYSSTSGNVDELYAPSMDLSASGFTAATLTFNVAYAGYTSASPENDQLEVLVSTNCGSTWSSVYNKAGNNLKTANTTTSAFTPTASQWRTESINLNSYVGQANLLVKFKATSDYGNNLYIDDINLALGTVGINEAVVVTSLEIFPNPAIESTTIALNNEAAGEVSIEVYDVVGKLVYSMPKTQMTKGMNKLEMNTASLNAGLYMVKVISGNKTITSQLTVTK